MPGSMAAWRPKGSPLALDPDALIYQANIISAGSTITSAQLTAINSFIVGLKADSVWSKLKDVGTFTGANLTAALVKIKGIHATSYVNHNFVSGDYTAATGLKSNGTTKYLGTGVIPSTDLTIQSTHLSVYDRSLIATNAHELGAGSAAASLHLYHPYSDRKVYSDQYNESTAEIGSAALTANPPVGFIIGTKTDATTHVLYRNGASAATGATNAGSLPAVELYLFANNNAGSPSTGSNHYLSFFSVGDGLSATDAANLTARVQTLQHALTRSPVLVIAEGDSITQGNGLTSYATTAATSIGQPPLYQQMFAVPGAKITGDPNSLTGRATLTDAEFSAALYRKSVVLAAAGHNDLLAVSPATAFSDYKAYCLARRAVGFKIIACTLLPSTLTDFNTARNTFNTSVRSDASFYDVLCDFALDATMGPDAAAADTLLYSDGIHPTQAGQDLLAPIYQTALTALL